MTSYFIVNDWVKHDENIWEAENFINPDHCNDVIDYIKQSDSSCDIHDHSYHLPDPNANVFSWDPECLGEKGSQAKKYEFGSFEGIKNLLHSIEDAAARYTMQQMRLAKVVVHTYKPHSASPEHADVFPLATLLYLNNDYEGGELHFPKQDMSIRPEKGSLLCFKGGIDYSHEVKLITGDKERYVLVAFWDYEDSESLQDFWDAEQRQSSSEVNDLMAERERLESFDKDRCNVLHPMTFPILEIKDFITAEEAEKITEFLLVNDVENNECWGAPCFDEYWAVQHSGEPVDLIYPEGIDKDTMKNLNNRIRKAVEHFLNSDDIAFSKFKGHDYITYASAPPHVHEPAIAVADLMLNDNYEGGETFFPTLDISIAPNARSLYVYAEDSRYKHGVTCVDKGVRYSIASHWQPSWHEYSDAGANI